MEHERGLYPGDSNNEVKCIHGNVKEYRTKWADISIGPQTFRCRVDMVPWLDCGVLIRKDCPILPQLLGCRMTLHPGPVRILQTESTGVDLTVDREDPSLQLAAEAA